MTEQFCPKSLSNLFIKNKETSYRLDVYYCQSLFSDRTDENFDCLYFQACNKPVIFMVLFVETIVRIFVNRVKFVAELLIDYIFVTKPVSNLIEK